MAINKNNLSSNLIQFPLNVLGMLKHRFLSSVPADTLEQDLINSQRCNLMHLTVDETIVNFVPYLFDIEQMDEEDVSRYEEDGQYIFPSSTTTALESIQMHGLYLMDMGDKLILYVDEQRANQTLLVDIFGTTDLSEIHHQRNGCIDEDNLYYNSDNPINTKLHYLIHELRQ